MSEPTDNAKRDHIPDKSKLPKALHSLDWQPMAEEFFDGDRLLVAVPVCLKSNEPDGDWYYELEFVSISCDEDFFSTDLSASGDAWGWDITDADWMVRL